MTDFTRRAVEAFLANALEQSRIGDITWRTIEILDERTGVLKHHFTGRVGVTFDDFDPETAMRAALEAVKVAEWECFSDTSYFDMWCVRPVKDRRFGTGFHVVDQESAERLRDYLNSPTPS